MSPSPVATTLSQVESLLSEAERATPSPEELESLARSHRPGAVNLRHYLALRRHDLRHLQQALPERREPELGQPLLEAAEVVPPQREVVAEIHGACTVPVGQRLQLLHGRRRALHVGEERLDLREGGGGRQGAHRALSDTFW